MLSNSLEFGAPMKNSMGTMGKTWSAIDVLESTRMGGMSGSPRLRRQFDSVCLMISSAESVRPERRM